MPTKNKDFKPGDKVTVIINGRIVCVGTVSGVFHKYNVEIVTRDGGVRLFDSGSVYHGHNVKVEVTGEELPERLRVEEVEVLWKNIITYHSDSGCPVSMTIKMPAHMAKEYCEWIKEQE